MPGGCLTNAAALLKAFLGHPHAGAYALGLSSIIYGKLWTFQKQSLPADLIRRCRWFAKIQAGRANLPTCPWPSSPACPHLLTLCRGMVKETTESPEADDVFSFQGKTYRCLPAIAMSSSFAELTRAPQSAQILAAASQLLMSTRCLYRLLFDDYPFAADGILLWKAIHRWASQYVSLYYNDPADLAGDEELQQWWADVKAGHADKSEGWPEPKTAEVLALTAQQRGCASLLNTGVIFPCTMCS